MIAPIDNPMFGDLTPVAVTETIKRKPFALKYKRHCNFVIKNKVNDLFVLRTNTAGKITYSDVPLIQASQFAFKSIDYVISEMYVLNPNLDLEPCVIFRHPKTKKLCVK